MERWKPYCIALLLVLVTGAAYWQVTSHPFIEYDDPSYVLENPQVVSGLSGRGLVWAFTAFHSGNWHPLTWLSHQADITLFGLNAGGHHLTNLILHVINTLLVMLLFSRLTGAVWCAAAVAGLFALHPLHVESVAWVAERKDLLCAFFFLLTLLAYQRYTLLKHRNWYLLALTLFAAALMSKPMAVTLPLLLLLIDWWPLGRFAGSAPWPLVIEKIPFFALSLASSAVTFMAQKAGGAVISIDHVRISLRLSNAVLSCATYLLKSIWPTRLALLYPFPVSIPAWQVSLALAALVLMGATAFLHYKRRPYLAFGFGWYLVMLIPVIGVVQVGNQAMADRYTYLPLLGIFLAVSLGFHELLKGKEKLLTGGTLVLLTVLAVMTRQQAAVWKDNETIFRHTLESTDRNPMMRHNLGMELSRQGRWLEAAYEEEKAVQLWPMAPEPRLAYGNALFNAGRMEEAAKQFRTAIALNPSYSEAYNNLGATLHQLGRQDEAIHYYREALRMVPGDEKARNNLERLIRERQGQK